MPALKKFRATRRIIVYPFLLDFPIPIDSRSLMITRIFQGDDSHIAPPQALACLPALQATPSLELGVSGCGMIHLDCHLGLEEIRFVCLFYRMQFGSSAHRRKIICRSKMKFALSEGQRTQSKRI